MTFQSFKYMFRKAKGKNGSASALIILVLTVLTLLGVLSLVTVASDYRLSQKRADWQKEYFIADSVAVGFQADLDQQISKLLIEYKSESGRELADLVAQDLGKWLEQPNIQDASLQPEENLLNISASIGPEMPPGPSDQMINLQFALTTDRSANNFGLLTVTKWAQWQVSPPSSEEGGIIWIP